MLTLVAVPVGVAPALLTREAWRAIEAAASVYADPALLAGLPADLEARPLPVADPRLPNDAAALPAVWLVPAGSLPAAQAAVGDGRGEVTVVSAPDLPAPDVLGAELLELVAVMDRLRSPGGCPWDAQQTHASLVPYLLEETYEVLEALETGDDAGLREELGDLLLQVVFHARLAQERPEGPWSVDDVARGITAKLVRRHPHVFGDTASAADAPTAAHVEANWELLKAAEKQRTSLTDGIPLAQPALALVAKLHSRVRKAGLDVPLPTGLAGVTTDRLLAMAVEMQEAGLDPEAELRAAGRAYAAAIRAAEASSRGADDGDSGAATSP